MVTLVAWAKTPFMPLRISSYKSRSLGAGGIWIETTGTRVLPSFLSKWDRLSQKLLNDPGLAHPGRAIDDQAWHSISRGIVDQVQQSFQDAFSPWILDPALLTKPMDAFVIVQEGGIAMGRLQMGKLVRLQGPSQISTGYGFISTDASFADAG